jgi:hypothetical protein
MDRSRPEAQGSDCALVGDFGLSPVSHTLAARSKGQGSNAKSVPKPNAAMASSNKSNSETPKYAPNIGGAHRLRGRRSRASPQKGAKIDRAALRLRGGKVAAGFVASQMRKQRI